MKRQSPRVEALSHRFDTTEWSVVLMAGRDDSNGSWAALEQLCQRYWRPIYAFARGRGCSEHDAQDLTQGFFADLLQRKAITVADPERGRFRTFLLTAFRHFSTHAWRRSRADRRGGITLPIPLEELTDAERAFAARSPTELPDHLFDLEWAERVFLTALDRLRLEFGRAGKSVDFAQLSPYLSRPGGAGDYARIASELGWRPESVPVAVHRLRRRYGELTRAEVAGTVSDPRDVEDELRYLAALFDC